MLDTVFNELPLAVTVSDKEGKIIYMNNRSAETFASSGGADLIGKSLYDCHNPRSVDIIGKLLGEGIANTYTIEKNGVKKLIHQAPWYRGGEVAGLIEFSIVLPDEMPHHKR